MQPKQILRSRYQIIKSLGSGSFGNTYIEIVENLLNDGQSVVLFCEFLDAINELEQIFNSKRISCEKIVGSIPKDERTNIVERFQNKNRTYVLLLYVVYF